MILFFILSACNAPARLQDEWTGAVTVVSAEYEVFRAGAGRMSARAVQVTTDGQIRLGVLTSVRRTGRNGPRVTHVTSHGVTLEYRRLDRLFTQCLDRCQRTETGFLALSREAFAIAARTGLAVRVQGERGRYEGTVPSAAFQTVLAGGSS